MEENTHKMSLKERVLSTMKCRETESDFELYVTRTPGYLWALVFRWLHIHPITVTLLSIVIGAAAGYFFWFDSLKMNLIGMLLLIWANWYDCADGQLARMTDQKTLIGRILDGFGGDVWFLSIYVCLSLRMTPDWGIWIWLLCSWAGFHCHSTQSAVADYYRNVHMWVLQGDEGSELARSTQLRAEMEAMKWNSKQWFHKFYLRCYIHYTERQERQCPALQQLLAHLREAYPTTLPEDIREDFLSESRPMMKYANILTTDTRVGALFFALFVGMPWIYPVFESTVLEALRFYTVRRHERFCRRIDEKLMSHES